MVEPSRPSAPTSRRPSNAPTSAEQRVAAIADFLSDVDEAVAAKPRTSPERTLQEQLASKRLGIASSLFLALRAKHPPTAAHCLRVALGCSAWAAALGLPEPLRDAIEIAGLLHDVGKVGVPDHVLMKPGKLVGNELLAMDRHRLFGLEILEACCDSPAILEVVRYSGAWYDGSRHGFDRAGEDLPLGTRMLSIVDAFDSMTTEHVYRRALPRERAFAELFEYAGTQFDPRLVREFSKLVAKNGLGWETDLARRWLKEIEPNESHALLRSEPSRTSVLANPSPSPVDEEFHERLLQNMHDGVFFVDADRRILEWNRAAERLTGIRATAMVGRPFVPSILQMTHENGLPIDDEDCPVANAIVTGVQTLQRVAIAGRGGASTMVNLHLVPVLSGLGERKGAAVLLHDASSQVTLEERVQVLHKRATQDPLTKVANRAEFDRVLSEFVETHLAANAPCSLIICDIDHFKKINDVHGHQAGDEALISFAATLRKFGTPGDLVARYGGEEFVMLCANCDNATATERAEEIRRTIAAIPQSMLGGRCITASFGVTEIQAGDTPETMLRRADRALLQAKDSGRNRVVQLGTGISPREAQPERRRSWFSGWTSGPTANLQLTRDLWTSVPLNIAAEKLKGFISDHHAEIVSVAENEIEIKIDGPYTPLLRRQSDRAVPFIVRLEFQEASIQPKNTSAGTSLRTRIHVEIRPARKRDRRRRDVEARSVQLLVSLKSYFMAQEVDAKPPDEEPSQDEPRERSRLGFPTSGDT